VVTPLEVSAADKQAAGVDKLALPLVTADLAYRDPTLVLRSNVRDAAGGRLDVEAQSRLTMKELMERDPRLVARLRHRPLHGKLVMKKLDPAAVALFVPSLRRVEGRLTAALALTGTAADPAVKGELRWKDGGVVTAHEGATPPRDEATTNSTSEAVP
jgi:autotransporter translocation and assembly factor TamB